MKPIYLLVSLVFFFYACTKDNGNYEYTDVNRMTIVDTSNQSISNRTFDIKKGDSLVLEMSSTGTLKNFDPSKVEYEWKLEDETIATGNKVVFNESNIKAGTNQLALYAKDPLTGLAYYLQFKVILSASISRGFFMLGTDESGESALYFKSSTDPKSRAYSIKTFGMDNEYKIGADPLAIRVYKAYPNYSSIMVYTKSGENVFYQIDLVTLLPVRITNGTNNGLDGSHSQFEDVVGAFNASTGDAMILDNGKLRPFKQGFATGDINPDPSFDYKFSPGGYAFADLNSYNGRMVIGYDELSQRIIIFNPRGSKLYDFAKPDLSLASEKLEGLSLLSTGGNNFDDKGGMRYTVLMNKQDSVYSYQTSLSYNFQTGKYVTTKVNKAAANLIPNISKAKLMKYHRWSNFFYYVIGRTIYRMTNNSLSARALITLPDDGSGDIVSWNFDDDAQTNLQNFAIATYNPNAKESKKGSIYHYKFQSSGDGALTTLQTSSLYEVDKIKSISIGIQ